MLGPFAASQDAIGDRRSELFRQGRVVCLHEFPRTNEQDFAYIIAKSRAIGVPSAQK